MISAFLPHCINRIFFSSWRIRKKKNPFTSFTSWWIKFAHFFCSLGDLPADVDLQTGVRGGGKAVCRQEVPLIYIYFFYSTATFIMLSSWTLSKGQHLLWFKSDPGLRNTSRLLSVLLCVFFLFCFVLSTSTCMSMKHPFWVYCEHLQSKLSCDGKKMLLFFIYNCLLSWKLFTETSFQFWLLSWTIRLQLHCQYPGLDINLIMTMLESNTMWEGNILTFTVVLRFS